MLCNMVTLSLSFSDNLSDEEQARLQTISHPAQAKFYQHSRCLLRTLLGQLLHQPPAEICFSTAAHGKPQLTQHQLQFNISHSQHWLCIALATVPVGVDIEFTAHTPVRPWLALAKRFFTANEYQYLIQQSAEQLAEHFFQLWIQKEAVLKAHGGGISAGLQRLDLLTHLHSLDEKIYTTEYSQPIPELHCAVSLQTKAESPINYYILNDQLEIEPLQPPYIHHLCLKPNSL
nr:4'-phosphopantetheinyl transferase superfamily protein [uncultured Tolumonas sp.]